MNTACSALSSILVLEDGVKFGEHPLVACCMKGIFELKPALPKYTEIWDVNIVFGYLRAAAPLRSLSLKQLTLNLTMLLCRNTDSADRPYITLMLTTSKKWMTAT